MTNPTQEPIPGYAEPYEDFDDRDVLVLREAARLEGRCIASLRRDIREGRLPCMRAGNGHIRIRVKDLRAAARQRHIDGIATRKAAAAKNPYIGRTREERAEAARMTDPSV
jgi:hypothetical protein